MTRFSETESWRVGELESWRVPELKNRWRILFNFPTFHLFNCIWVSHG